MSLTQLPEDVGESQRPAVSVQPPAAQPPAPTRTLVEEFKEGLDAPICLTWELTYACNLSCVHCLSSSGRRDPRELSTQECFDVIDELERLQVFYVNLGGGEPMLRPDFFEILEYAAAHHVGREVLDQRDLHRSGRRGAAGVDGLPRHPDLDRRCRRRRQRRGPGRGLLRRSTDRDGPPPRRRVRCVQDQLGGDPPQRRPVGRVQGDRRSSTARSCGSPGCGRRVAAPTAGTSCTRRRPSSASCTTGSWPAPTSSPATRSSTSRRSAMRCRG